MNRIKNTEAQNLVCSVQSTRPCLINKMFDAISHNPEAVTTVAYGLAIAVVFWGLGKGISEVVAKWKR